MLTVKKFLGDLYGLTTGFTYRELSRERFERKIEYMRDFIETVSKVDPGYTKVGGAHYQPLSDKCCYLFSAFSSGEALPCTPCSDL